MPARATPRPRAAPASAGDAGRVAVVAGATGLVGSHLLARLLAEPRYASVHAVSRRPLPPAQRPGSAQAAARLVEHVADLTALARWPDFPAADDAFCCLGTTIRAAGSQQAFRRVDFDAVVAFARAARRRGATRCIVVSALGADPGSRVFYNRVKGEAEAALAALDFPSLTVLRPSLLDGDRAERRPAERLGLALARPVAALIPPRWRPVAADRVAACMVAAAARGTPGLRIVESDRIVAGELG
jgi:uncharacterized protein YbjT (DUF2867 family)